MPTLTTAQIGKAGELLVQLRLLQLGVDSSHMTTDAGIDLVAFYPKSKRAATIQVKTNDRPKPSGGKGKLALDWWLPEKSPAELIALVDLSELRVWLSRTQRSCQAPSRSLAAAFTCTCTPTRARPQARTSGPFLSVSSPNTCLQTVRTSLRPNPSLKLTRYGRRCKPGPRQSYHRRAPGLQRLPPRAA